MTHHGPSVQNLSTKLPPFELNARQRDFISDALYEAGVSRLQRDGICLTLAALHNIRPDQRSSGRPEGDSWKLVSIYGLAQRRDLSERAIRRHLTSMAKAGLIDKGDHLGPRAGIWVRYDALNEILPPPKGTTSSTKSSTKSSDHFEAGTGISPPSINSGNNRKKRTPLTPQGGNQTGGDSIGENPQLKKTFDAMAGRGMERSFESFCAIVSETGDASPAVVNRALLNLESGTRYTVAAKTWADDLKEAKTDIAKEPAPLRPYAELQAESEADRDEHGRVVRDENGNPVKSKPKDRVVIASAPVNGSTCEAEKNPPQAPPAAPPAAAAAAPPAAVPAEPAAAPAEPAFVPGWEQWDLPPGNEPSRWHNPDGTPRRAPSSKAAPSRCHGAACHA